MIAGPFAALPVLTNSAGIVAFSVRQRAGADDVILTPEVSDDLVTWQSDPGDESLLEFGSSSSHPDGTRTMVYRLPAVVADQRFVRLAVQTR